MGRLEGDGAPTPSRGRAVRVVAYVPDLMDRSRIRAAVPGVVFATDPAGLATTDADVVVVDLSRPGVLDAVAGLGVPVVGFAGHAEHDLLARARAAGCRVLVRSVFFRDVAAAIAAAGAAGG